MSYRWVQFLVLAWASGLLVSCLPTKMERPGNPHAGAVKTWPKISGPAKYKIGAVLDERLQGGNQVGSSLYYYFSMFPSENPMSIEGFHGLVADRFRFGFEKSGLKESPDASLVLDLVIQDLHTRVEMTGQHTRWSLSPFKVEIRAHKAGSSEILWKKAYSGPISKQEFDSATTWAVSVEGTLLRLIDWSILRATESALKDVELIGALTI